MTSFDSPWKEALEQYLRQLLALLFPKVEREVDWSQGYDSLEQEFRPLLPEGETGLRLADKLIRVHLAQRTQNDDEERARAKLDLLVRLAERKLDEVDRRHWHRFLGWLLNLPADMDAQVFAQVRAQKGEKAVEIVGYAERLQHSAWIEARLEGLEALLEAKFQQAGLALMPDLRKIEDAERLATILQGVRKATSLDEVRALLAAPSAESPTS